MPKRESIIEFKNERARLNDIVMKYAGLETKRFFSLDSQVYREGGALPVKIKEMLGLVASLVLRCDDCIKYHIIRCYEEKVSDAELEEAISISLIVGGSITIPHLRRAYDAWEELKSSSK
jgi:AhpD family alkylhydroperoxidase